MLYMLKENKNATPRFEVIKIEGKIKREKDKLYFHSIESLNEYKNLYKVFGDDVRLCRNCGHSFFLIRSQKSFYRRNKLSLPTHCSCCLASRKAARERRNKNNNLRVGL